MKKNDACNKEEIEALLLAARNSAEYAYAPYSKFRVGAAVLADNRIFQGANIENASSNLGICAERVAISHALMHGCMHIEGIAICCMDAILANEKDTKTVKNNIMPCGGCLQWISELAPHAWIVTEGTDDIYKIDDLMPIPFKLL